MHVSETLVAACIVTYNPDINRLKMNIESIINQVSKIIIVWNSEIIDIGLSDKKLIFLGAEINEGIAKAINYAIDYCIKNGYEWLLTLDQDSICPNNLIQMYTNYLSNDTGLVTCGINYNNKLIKNTDKPILINECIQSGALLNINAAKELGGMDESMFIDQVDFEYCYRLKNKNYKLIQINKVYIDHQLGELAIKKIGPLKFYVGNHSALRKYYIARNTIYCHRKHPEWRSNWFCIKKICGLIFKTLLFEKEKHQKNKAILRGINDAFKMKV